MVDARWRRLCRKQPARGHGEDAEEQTTRNVQRGISCRALMQPESRGNLAPRCVSGGINADLINCLARFSWMQRCTRPVRAESGEPIQHPREDPAPKP